jgi:sec-independent protein translocase protein TatA
VGEFSIWHWMVVLLVVLLLFGGGKISGLMGDLAKGIKAFKTNMADQPDASEDAGGDKASGTISGLADDAAPRARTHETTQAQ